MLTMSLWHYGWYEKEAPLAGRAGPASGHGDGGA